VKTHSELTGAATQQDSRVFDLWAQVYDTQSNPLLKLEERSAMPLLPPLSGGDVLDVGCGTGRWLTKLETLNPASLIGTDCSTTMLERARAKVYPSTKLEHRECSTLPGENASKNFVLASFVLSYLSDLHGFANECVRILRPDGWVLISDMHPATATRRSWTRSFRVEGEKVEIAVHSRSLNEIVSTFHHYGFELRVLMEPPFAAPERPIFEESGKLAEFDELAGAPAIYILKLQKRAPSPPVTAPRQSTLQLTSARIGLGPATWREGTVLIERGRVACIRENGAGSARTLDLVGYSLLPGLINAHDHLEFGLFPKLGRSADAPTYRNSPEWGEEIHQVHTDIIERYKRIPKTTQLWWGAIRNLLCGVTTVCHHNPLHADLTRHDFPVRVLSRFGWSHSLALDPHLAKKFQVTPKDHPFIIHAAEGIDEGSRNEIFRLDQMGVLDKRTVLVHGLACTAKEISLINRRGAALVVCPTSNSFLFAKTLSRDLLTSIERAALGSDSPITAAGDLLDEVSYLHTETCLHPNTIYNMVTSNPAEILHLQDGQGRIQEFGVADLIAVRSQHNTPARALSELAFTDVELVLLAGIVQMASPLLYAQLPDDLRSGMELIEVAGLQRWIRAHLQGLFEAAERILGQNKLLLGGRPVRYLGASPIKYTDRTYVLPKRDKK
jgi:cytosine/adenosine deaminase-related metal-dependent hydrolase/ubiquinone/menaquinone biosynthesis C-methylase UbiE